MVEITDVFKALGDPTRLRIIRMLVYNGDVCVCTIASQLGMSQPAVSHHLSVLKHAGLVEARRQGQWMHYSFHREVLVDVVQPFILTLLERQDVRSALADNCCNTETS